MWKANQETKGRDLTQSYDKSPYTNRIVKRVKWQHKQRHKKSTAPSKSNQLRNVNTLWWESWIAITQPWEINDKKSEVIAFVVNAGINVTTSNFNI